VNCKDVESFTERCEKEGIKAVRERYENTGNVNHCKGECEGGQLFDDDRKHLERERSTVMVAVHQHKWVRSWYRRSILNNCITEHSYYGNEIDSRRKRRSGRYHTIGQKLVVQRVRFHSFVSSAPPLVKSPAAQGEPLQGYRG
jgi:hypothetical protein